MLASRPVGGQLGSGQLAALESASAARRMVGGPAKGEDVHEALVKLAHLNERVDVKIAAAVEHGFREKLYLQAIKLPALGQPGPDGIVRAAQKYIAVDSPARCELLHLASSRLRRAFTVRRHSSSHERTPRAALAAALDVERKLRPAP